MILPNGSCSSRATLFHTPGRQPGPPFWTPPFQLPPLKQTDEKDPGRRVSLTLAPVPGAPPGKQVAQNLDQMLETVAQQCGLNVIADGYLRPPTRVPANTKVKDFPVTKLLDQLAQTWGCEWRFLDKEEKTVIFRAQGWSMEDAADVPQPLVEEFRRSLGGAGTPALADLARLADLSTRQVHKLVECGLCPAASGVIVPGFYDEAGAKAVLQFFNRLPATLQARTQTAVGLPLQAAPQDLVETFLLTTLIADVGAVTPELRDDLVLSINPAPSGFAVRIRNQHAGSTDWKVFIGLPAPAAAPARPPSAARGN